MDYGYQLLRHVVQQVFGNLGVAARLTLPILAIPVVLFALTNPGILTGAAMNVEPGQVPDINFGAFFLGVVIGLLAWCWAAVVWHRFVLLEEFSGGPIPQWQGGYILSYLGRSFLVGLIAVVTGIVLGAAAGLIGALLQSAAVLFVLFIGVAFGISWVATRVGLILPAAAIGQSLTIGESWSITKPVGSQIFLPIFVIALVSSLASQLAILALGANLVGGLVSLAVSWLQMLVNLALLTTLYGNLIEGRQLN